MKRILILIALSAPAFAGDAAPAPKADNLTEYKDAEAGYTFKIPAGYTRLTQDQIRMAFKGLSESLGRNVAEKTLLRPPAYFQGPLDAAHPKFLPPVLAIGMTALSDPIDPALMSKYKDDYVAYLQKNGEMGGDVAVELADVNGVRALRVERDVFSPIDNTRMRQVLVSVPGDARRYDIVFSFNKEQWDEVKSALETVMKSFTVSDSSYFAGSSSRWVRVALYTVGGLVLGLLLGIIFNAIAGGKQAQPAQKQA